MRIVKKAIGPAIAVLVVVGLWYWFFGRKKQDAGPPVATATVERRDLVVSVIAVGAIEPLTTVDVKANVAGEIIEMAVDRGDAVLKGDLIARIDPTETKTQFEQAQANVQSANARVAERAADQTRQSRSTSAQVSAASSSIRSADARVRQAESSLSYQRRVTETEIRQAEEALETARSRVRQAEARANAQPGITSSTISRAEAALRASKQSLSKLTAATHPQERAAVKAQLAAAKIALDTEEKKLQRVERLLQRGGASQQELDTAQSLVADARDRYESAQAASDTLQQKQAAELQEAQAQVDQAEASLETARAGAVDVEVAREELATARASLREAEAALVRAQAGKAQDAVKEDELKAARAAAGEARAQMTVARANTLSAVAAAHQVTQARADTLSSKAQLDNARKNLGYTTVVAPRDGLVIDRYVEEGTVISSGRSAVATGPSIITIADVSRMFVLAEVDEADIGQVKVGQSAEVQVETLPDKIFAGKVVQMYPRGTVENDVVTFMVRVEILDPNPLLKPAMTAEVNIICARKEQVLAAPTEAIFRIEGQSVAELYKGEKAPPEQVPVVTGLADFEWTEIVSGLKEGDQLVLESMGGKGGPGGRGGPGGNSRAGGSQENMRRMMRMGAGPGGGRR